MGTITELHQGATNGEPPHSVEAEQQILGALLLGQPTNEVYAAGGESLFYDPVHAGIFQICRRLEKAEKPVTPVTVNAMLGDELKAALLDLGGSSYIAKLAGAAITPRLIASYAEVLAEAKASRDLLALMDATKVAMANGDLSASDAAARIEAGLTQMQSGPSRIAPVSMMTAATEALDEAFRAYSNEQVNLVRPGIVALERIAPGFAPGEMWLLGGRPSMGKSSVALSMALNAARAGHGVVIASLEMTPSALAMRALSEATTSTNYSTSYMDIRQGAFSEDQARALHDCARHVSELPIIFLPREYQDADLMQVGVKQALRRLPQKKTPLVVVDYAQLMRSKARTRYEQITDVSMALKGMAMNLELPVIALSQLSRAVEQRDDKRPMMSDLRESGQLEQDADGVMFCYRDEYYLERQRPSDESDLQKIADWEALLNAARNRLEIIVAKQRQGRVGTAHVRLNPATNHIWED